MADDIYVTVETEQIASVSSVGIQGLSATTGSVENIANVDATNLEDGSVLVYSMDSLKWVAQRVLEKQKIIGGLF